jgi:hypothetical protein
MPSSNEFTRLLHLFTDAKFATFDLRDFINYIFSRGFISSPSIVSEEKNSSPIGLVSISSANRYQGILV